MILQILSFLRIQSRAAKELIKDMLLHWKLKEWRSKKTKQKKKWKTIQEEIKEVKQQKISLEASILYLREKADKLAFESEKAKNLEGMKGLITESNALKKKNAFEKESEKTIRKRNLVITKKYLLNLWHGTYKKREHWIIFFFFFF